MSEAEVRSAAVTRATESLPAFAGVSHVVETDGLRLHSLVYGAGPLDIVVLPGITSPAPTWDFVATYLTDLARVVVIDIRGRGLSDAPPSGYQLTNYVADTLAICDALELDRPVLLGHSLGARIAAAAAAAAPDRFGPAILMDPPLSGPGRPYPTPWPSFHQQLTDGITGTTIEAVRAFYPRWADRELGIRVDWLATCLPAAIKETYDAFEVDRFETAWAALTGQATLIYGGASPVVTADDLTRLQQLQPSATMVGIEGAGHMIPWDEPTTARTVLRSLIHPLAAARAADSHGGTR